MKSKRKFLYLAIVLVIALSLSLFGCGGSDDDAASEQEKITPKILVTKGACADVINTLPKGYDIQVCETDDEVKSEVLKGGWSLAVLDAKKAGQLYLESKKSLQVISPLQIDGLKILQKNYNEKIQRKLVKNEETKKFELVEFVKPPMPSMLTKHKLTILDSRGGVEESVLNHFLDANNVKLKEDMIEYAEDTEDFYKDMKKHKRFGLATEPVATDILDNKKSVKEVFDLDEWWQEETGYALPIKVLIADNEFLREHKVQAEDAFEDIGNAISDFQEPKGLNLVFFFESNRGIRLLERFYEKDELLSEKLDENFYYND